MYMAKASEMREIDRVAIEDMGIPSTLLMTNAAERVVEAALDLLEPGDKVAVFCGSGNNGGDGVAAAVALMKKGHPVDAFLVGSRARMTPDTQEMERRLAEIGGVLKSLDNAGPEAEAACESAAVIIDAMFGIGLNAPLRGMAAKGAELMNRARGKVIAADIPSGVHADTGTLLGEAVAADVTVTFTLPKPGQYTGPGCDYCGEIRVADIGIPEAALGGLNLNTRLCTEEDVRLPARRRNTHKGNYGKLLLLGGAVGYTGAPTLAALGALRSGAGLVVLGVPAPIYEITAVKNLEVMPHPLPADGEGRLSEAALPWILEKLKDRDACLIGPGLGRSQEIFRVVADTIRAAKIPIVVDADGINALSENIHVLDEADAPLILTPHEGEFARLGGRVEELGRLEAAREFAVIHRCTLVLKGPGTVSAFPDGTAFVNTTGNPGMAKGGSGDVLSGILTALLGQGLGLKKAVTSSVWIHGRAGDLLAERMGTYAMTPGDLTDALPEVFKFIVR